MYKNKLEKAEDLLESIIEFPAPPPVKCPTIWNRTHNKIIVIELQNGLVASVQNDSWGNGIQAFSSKTDEDFPWNELCEEKTSNETPLGKYIFNNFKDVKNIWIGDL
jgi:hypothetical protein